MSERVTDGIPFYCSKEIIMKNNGEEISECDYIPAEVYETISKKFGVPQYGDLLLTTRGSIGVPYLYRQGDCFYFADGNLTWLKDFNSKLLPSFLYYWFKSHDGFEAVNAIAKGTAQKAVSIIGIKNLEIPCPPLPVQRRIADILSAYDDLIENNRKQIKLLEEAAQRLYKEWFIDLRFPGHEHTPIINGIPAGWKVGPAIDFFNITIGKTPPRSEHQCFTRGEAGIPWVSISDMGASGAYMFSTAEGLTRESVVQYNVKIIPAGTILLSFKLTLGRVTIATESCCTNEAIAHFYMLETKLTEYTYLYLRNFKYDTLGNTSSISRAVNSSIVKGMTFVMPPATIISEFSKRLKPVFQKIYLLQRSALLAQSSRDRLLPKLMSGEIDLAAAGM